MDIEGFLLGLLDSSANFDFNVAIRGFLISLAVIWLFVVVWVWMDSGERSRNIFFRLLSVLIVLILNILGLIIYLLMRPKDSIENLYWSDLERRFLVYETSGLGDCENCGLQLRPSFNVCPECAYPVKFQCGNCNEMIEKYWQFCPYCSTKQENQFLSNYQETSPGLTEGALLSTGMVNMDLSNTLEKEQPLEEEVKPETNELPKEESKVENKSDEDVEDTKETIPSKEDIVQRVEDSKEHMIEEIEEKGMKYEKSPGIAVRLGNYVMKSIYSFGEKINKTALRVSGQFETPNQQNVKGAPKEELKKKSTPEKNKNNAKKKPKAKKKRKQKKIKSTKKKSSSSKGS